MKAWAILLVLLVGVALAQSRFSISGNVITDGNTGLQWRVGPDRHMTWHAAKAWVDGLGGNWRMPTYAELRGLWNAGVGHGNWGPFENSGFFVWSGTSISGPYATTASAFYFDDEVPRPDYETFFDAIESYFFRAFAVRSR